MCKISFVVPTYNSGSTIKRCIESISRQNTDMLYEIIVIDDGSTDDTRKIVSNLSLLDNCIKYYYQTNCGVSAARNKGIDLACGDFVMFVDSDDELKCDYLEALFSNISNDELIVGGIELHQDNGNKNITYQGNYSVIETIEEYGDKFSTLLLNGPCGKIFSLNIIKSFNICFDTTISLGEDTLFVFEYLKHCDYVEFVDYAGYIYYQLGTTSLMTKYRDDAYYLAKNVYERLIYICYEICGFLPLNFKNVYKNVLMVYIRKLIFSNKYDKKTLKEVINDYVNDNIVITCVKNVKPDSLFMYILDWLTFKKHYLLFEMILVLHVKIRGV